MIGRLLVPPVFVLFDRLFCKSIELRNVELALKNSAEQLGCWTSHAGLTGDLHERRLELRHLVHLGWRRCQVFIREQVSVDIDEVNHLLSRGLVLHRVDLLAYVST